MYKTTKKDFEEFKKECERMKKILDIGYYELIYKHENLDKHNVDGGMIEVNSHGYATVYLDTEIDDRYYHSDWVKATARHEMCHILTEPLVQLAYDRYTTQDHIYKESEKLVRKIEYFINKK